MTRIPDLDAKIEAANEAYATWFKFWEDYYEGKREPKSSFLRESRESLLLAATRIRPISLPSPRRSPEQATALACRDLLR